MLNLIAVIIEGSNFKFAFFIPPCFAEQTLTLITALIAGNSEFATEDAK